MSVDLNNFEIEANCTYKNERYSVRDNGAVLRHARENKPLRKYDNQWTFGTLNHNNYLIIVSEVVHRIVAFAFLGDPPTTQHVVDHIDTNRHNNRPENLRWFTKLENILNNPFTVKKIIFLCGSIEAFLEDPSILKDHAGADPNFVWMRAVTPEEAKNTWDNLNKLSERKNQNPSSSGNKMGEWIFTNNQRTSSFPVEPEFIVSLTPNAIQKKWKIPSEFPCCPEIKSNNPIVSYAANLKVDKIFSKNNVLFSVVLDFVLSKNEDELWVMCKFGDEKSTKPWSLAQVTFEDELFVHTSLGSFFSKEGAEKQFTLLQGLEWTGEDSIDDYC